MIWFNKAIRWKNEYTFLGYDAVSWILRELNPFVHLLGVLQQDDPTIFF